MGVDLDRFVRDVIAESRGASCCYAHELDPATIRTLLVAFNRSIDSLVYRFGKEPIGEAICYLYGCVGDLGRDALDSAAGEGLWELYRSLEDLYEDGFAAHCLDAGQSGSANSALSDACFMFWDMDGGLQHQTWKGRPQLFGYGVRLVEFGLSHRHAAVQESFLHCLNHLHTDRPQFVAENIDRFLRRRDLQPEIREYASGCRSGNAM